MSAPVLVSLGHEVGTVAIDVNDVFREALKVGANAIIVAHNHPSGDLTPSKGDVETTKGLQSLSDRLGLKFIDHLIMWWKIVGERVKALIAGWLKLPILKVVDHDLSFLRRDFVRIVIVFGTWI